MDAADRIPKPVRDAIRDTTVADDRAQLAELAAQPPGRQAEIAQALASGEAETVRAAKAAIKRRANAEIASTEPNHVELSLSMAHTRLLIEQLRWGEQATAPNAGSQHAEIRTLLAVVRAARDKAKARGGR